jgi:hypothetical protein
LTAFPISIGCMVISQRITKSTCDQFTQHPTIHKGKVQTN